VIDGFFVNGSAKAVQWASFLMRRIQTGYVYQYAFTMIVGVVALLTLWVVRWL
jgi:NADH-quinone oxidoreductase subunit L